MTTEGGRRKHGDRGTQEEKHATKQHKRRTDGDNAARKEEKISKPYLSTSARMKPNWERHESANKTPLPRRLIGPRGGTSRLYNFANEVQREGEYSSISAFFSSIAPIYLYLSS